MNRPVSDSELTALKSRVAGEIEGLHARLVSVSSTLHANPETAFEEFGSSALLAETASSFGLRVERPAYGLSTAFGAEFGAPEGATVAILSEYDALPGVGHGCGHNVVAAIGLGAALGLHSVGEALPGRVRYLGTPAEERGCGKELMVRNGAFEGVDAAMMVHPFSVNAKAFRSICIAELHIVFRGRAGHAALAPDAAQNALDAVVQSYQSISNLRQHLRRGEHVTGVITHGGNVPNVFPTETRAHYFVRAATRAELDTLLARVEACLRAGAMATGCRMELSIGDAIYEPINVNLPLADVYEANAQALGLDFVDYTQVPVGGSDIGNVSRKIPVLHGLIACAPAEAAIHTDEFARWMKSPRAESAILVGAKALAMTALDYLADPELRRRVAMAQAGNVPDSQQNQGAAK